ncbi:glycoside hydrolase family 32 protein [Lachnospiraceae bacterium OttesenSCG-928-D06]|nr:glycoside hydrolase family 32 protein [Lachnospiraceae bacterium OttesenSCG-928-D06]
MDILDKARMYEEKKQKEIEKGKKPEFHVTPPVGWMNDPNGFSYYEGEYHLFFQYHPYGTNWGPMHWGHVKTKDFIRWENLPCAMAPDQCYDSDGCFSGSAVSHEGKHILMYTGVQESGDGKTEQIQCIAVGDGVNYEKYRNNPVIDSSMLPEGCSLSDFRDPKIWKEEDGFYSLVGNKTKEGGQLVLFSSPDGFSWKFESILDHGGAEYGKMWECPDFFPLDGRWVEIISPQFMRAKGLEFHNGNNTVYFVGDYDKQTKKFQREEAYGVDYGMDFYAPQTVETADGRRIMIGWLQNWDNYLTPEESEWSGIMTIPRELKLVDGKLFQWPVRELEGYRQNKVLHQNICINKETSLLALKGIHGRKIDLLLSVDVSEAESFSVHLAAGENYKTTLSYDAQKQILGMDRTESGIINDLLCTRFMKAAPVNGILELRIVMDRYTIEVFLNNGESAMTTLIYTPLEAEDIWFESAGTVLMNVEKYDVELGAR